MVTISHLANAIVIVFFHTVDDVGGGSCSEAAEDADSVDVGALGDTVFGSGDGTGAVGSVSVAVNTLYTEMGGNATGKHQYRLYRNI